MNYYLGQEHPDTASRHQLQPFPCNRGCVRRPSTPHPMARTHIFDSYATWQARPKLTFSAEGDYFIEREWVNNRSRRIVGPLPRRRRRRLRTISNQPRAPALAARTEYLSDRGGLFSNQTQALKEATALTNTP